MVAIKKPILIVGAGPSGLMMACQLAMHGVPFRIIEKRLKRKVYSGALIVQARTLEILNQMHLAEKAIDQGIIAKYIHVLFNGKKQRKLKIDSIGEGYSDYPFLLLLEQSNTEKLLTDFLSQNGHSIEYNTLLEDVYEDDKEICSTLRLPNGEVEELKTNYLIAADGINSKVRESTTIPFDGSSHELSLFVMDCKPSTDLSNDELTFSFTKNALTGFFPLKNGRWRIDGAMPYLTKENASLTFDKVKTGFSEKTKINIDLGDSEWFSIFHTQQRYASTFKKGNIFLIGDAAHVHSPIGAQGMNTGMQDAYNLAWKIGLAEQGSVDKQILDTYNSERQPIARKVVNSTDRVFRVLTSQSTFARIFRDLFFPVLFRIIFKLIESQTILQLFVFKSISQTGINYRKSTLTTKDIHKGFSKHAPKPGDRFPFFKFKLSDISVGRFTLLALCCENQSNAAVKQLNAFPNLIHTITFKRTTKNKDLFDIFTSSRNVYYLIRPDGYIACILVEKEIGKIEEYLNSLSCD